MPICRYQFNSNIKVPVRNGVCNRREKKQQNKGMRKKQLEHTVASGKKKSRKRKVVQTEH